MNFTILIIVSAAMMVAGLACVAMVLRDSKGLLPSGGMAWIAAVCSVLLIIAAGSLLALALAGRPEAAAEGINAPAADFAFTLVEDGTSRQLSDYRGNVILLNFWATWCQPCIAELPELDQLQRDFASSGLVVVTVSDEPQEELMRYTDLLPRETVSGFFEPDSLPQPYGRALAEGRPISYIVDKDGFLRRYIVGAGNYASFERMLKPYLGAGGLTL